MNNDGQGLSPRQRQVLTLKANGLTCKEIAKRVKPKATARSVSSILLRLYRKYGVNNDIQLAAVLFKLGELSLDDIDIPLAAEIHRRNQ